VEGLGVLELLSLQKRCESATISYSDLSGNRHTVPSLPLMLPHSTPADGKCAQCGADIIAPEWSEHLPDNRVRNVWSCEACGYQFEDSVRFAARETVDSD
jgi:hypothetical protein